MIDIKVYTDGACSNNGYENAMGGWGYIIIIDDKLTIANGKEIPSTNQRMELTAAIKAFLHLQSLFNIKEKESEEEKSVFPIYNIKLYTDSAYLYNCYKKSWWIKWTENNWLNSNKENVANKDLWEQLIPWFKKEEVEIIKVKAHSDDKYNEKVDALAKAAIF